jgi:hypothetical protein
MLVSPFERSREVSRDARGPSEHAADATSRERYRCKELLGTIKLHPRDGYFEAKLCASFQGLLPLSSEQ